MSRRTTSMLAGAVIAASPVMAVDLPHASLAYGKSRGPVPHAADIRNPSQHIKSVKDIVRRTASPGFEVHVST
jgi:hypothetical protein